MENTTTGPVRSALEYGSFLTSSKHWCVESFENQKHNTGWGSTTQHITCLDRKGDTLSTLPTFHCSNAICQTCLDLNTEFFPPGNTGYDEVTRSLRMKENPSRVMISTSWKALTESAASGDCQFCSVLVEGVRGYLTQEYEIVPSQPISIEILAGHTVLVFTTGLNLEFCVRGDQVTPVPVFGAAAAINRELEVQDCVEFVTSRMARCLRDPDCLKNEAHSPSQFLPTRLIDVGIHKGNSDIKLEIYPIAGEKYISLSHCWGSSQHMVPRTVKSNFEEQCRNMPWSNVPKTFQDAVAITRALKVRYLWIDSLCIIQDDTSDWKTEAKTMADVYANSYLTLAGSSSLGCSYGLLKPRYTRHQEKSNQFHREIAIPRTFQDENFTIYCRPAITDSHAFLSSLAHNKVGGTEVHMPLLSRAWCLQERLLSSRILHFCSDEMVWECKTHLDCECGFLLSKAGLEEGTDMKLGRRHLRDLFNHSLSSQSLKTKSDGTGINEIGEDYLLTWYQLVDYYSYLNLTFSSDRMHALEGIVTSLRRKTGWTYLSGLWLQDLVHGLLWSRMPGVLAKRNDKIFPTWSWAAIDSTDEGFAHDKEPAIIYDAETNRTWKQDPRVSIIKTSAEGTSNGKLPEKQFVILKAPITTAIVVLINEKPMPPALFGERYWALKLTSNKSEPKIVKFVWDIQSEYDEPSELEEGDEVYCILLGKSATVSEGLVLRKEVAGEYTRVGFLEYSVDEHGLSSIFERVEELVLV